MPLFRIACAGICAMIALASCAYKGPARVWPAPYPYAPEPYTSEAKAPEDPAAMPEATIFPKIRSVAVLPFMDSTFGKDNTLSADDMVQAADEFAAYLVRFNAFAKVLHPQEAMEAMQGTSYSVKRLEDLKEMANLLDCDAVVFGVIKQYKMYYPPELTISMRFYLARAERLATADEISSMAHSGIPVHGYNPTFFRQLWDQSAYYDGGGAWVKERLARYNKVHDPARYGFQADRPLRSKYDFLKFIAYDLADSLAGAKSGGGKAGPAPAARGNKNAPPAEQERPRR